MWIAALGTVALVTASGSMWLLPGREALAVSAAVAAAFVGLLARGMFSVRSSLVAKTHWRSDDARERRVALTFDDGPHPRWTPAILDVLRRHDVRATFFVIGENARRHPEVLQRMHAEGHEIGCHGDSHSWATPFFAPARMDDEVRRCLAAVRDATGLTPRFYRPPIGIRCPRHVGVPERNDLELVGMARRGLDTRRGLDPAAFARRFAAAAAGGEILALHDGEEPLHPVSREATVAALPAVLDGLAAKGLRPVRVSSLLAKRPYRESVSRGWTGRSRGGRFGMAVFAGVARLFGRRGCAALAPIVAAWFVVAHPRTRRASIGLRRRLHGPAGFARESAWALRHLIVFGRTMIDRMEYLHGGAPKIDVEVSGDAAAFAALESADGCLLVSGHFGDWMAASRVADFGGRRMSVVASQGMGVGPHQVRRDGGAHLFDVIDVDGDPVAVGADIAAALRGGGLVAMLADRKVSESVVLLPFLGADAAFPIGPWAVAMVTGAPVVVFFSVRLDDGRRVLELLGPIRVPKVARGLRGEAIRAGAAQFVGLLEEAVRRRPFHWSNFYDFWTVR
jgi:predicted LPLAT superfamily acyltransferase/peptidoglycan/xylan/chitin deacetylase (PgdA/CDA1 family)